MAGDGQPQAAAARAAVARAFQPIEGLEHLFQLLRGNAGAVVAHAQAKAVGAVDNIQLDVALAIAIGVIQQIIDNAAQRCGRGGQRPFRRAVAQRVLAQFGAVGQPGVQQAVYIAQFQADAGQFIAQIGQGFLHQRLHFVQVADKFLAHGVVVEHFCAQLQPGDRGFQVVAHRCQQFNSGIQVFQQM